MNEAAMDRRASAVTPTRLFGLVTNASGVHGKVPIGRRWGFIQTQDGKQWFFHEKQTFGQWPQEGQTVSFTPWTAKVKGQSDRAISVTLDSPK